MIEALTVLLVLGLGDQLVRIGDWVGSFKDKTQMASKENGCKLTLSIWMGTLEEKQTGEVRGLVLF